jgi:glycosyltransferase involved in cell wall biosynthesis
VHSCLAGIQPQIVGPPRVVRRRSLGGDGRGLAFAWGSFKQSWLLWRRDVGITGPPAPPSVSFARHRTTAAVVPCHREPPSDELLDALMAHVAKVVVVDDGMAAESASRLVELAAERPEVEVIRLPANRGKGHALGAGIARAAAVADEVLTFDADGQHPAAAVPSFLAAEGDLVIGNRTDRGAMPWVRRIANSVSNRLLSRATRAPIPDGQCGMRLLRERALAIPFPGGRYEAETRHLKACLREGLKVTWVAIPTIYGSERSAFRPIRDSARVLIGIFAWSIPVLEKRSKRSQPVP